ncbi:MAG: hypothetical protein ABIJ47_01465 [Candidatus Bathyarchaeota archaeon]
MKPGAGFRTTALTAAILLELEMSVATIQAHTLSVATQPSGGIPVPAAFAVGLAGAFLVARRTRRG